jgi:hypothetical protein
MQSIVDGCVRYMKALRVCGVLIALALNPSHAFMVEQVTDACNRVKKVEGKEHCEDCNGRGASGILH